MLSNYYINLQTVTSSLLLTVKPQQSRPITVCMHMLNMVFSLALTFYVNCY